MGCYKVGLFGFLKRKKPILSEDIKTSSEWLIKAMNLSGYRLDLSIKSLKEIDRFFADNLDDELHQPKKDSVLSRNTGAKLFAIGSYVGETIINDYGGQWVTDDNDPYGEINIAVRLNDNSLIWPVQRVMGRCFMGVENNIYVYGIALKQ
jgi:hypothetical protein